MTVLNDYPHPRVLFEGMSKELHGELDGLVATARFIDDTQALANDEWDVLVTTSKDAHRRDAGLHILAFGADDAGRVTEDSTAWDRLSRGGESLSETYSVPPHVNPEIHSLVRDSIFPHLPREGKKRYWRYRQALPPNAPVIVRGKQLNGVCSPLITLGRNDDVLAFERKHSTNPTAISWHLPPETTQHVEWVKLFLRRLHEIDPQTFPGDPEWASSQEWATPKILDARDQLAGAEAAKTAALEKLDTAITAARQKVDVAVLEAAKNAHRLLTSQSKPLVKAVVETLSDIGFDVEEMDEYHLGKSGVRLEDLRIKDPEDSTWISLGEVKGYKKGVKVNEIPKITQRPCANYLSETGKSPSTVWFIANHDFERHPSDRSKFVSNPETDLDPLTTYDGAGIDTRDLFRAWRDVTSGQSERRLVMDSLKAARGLWSWPET